MKNAFKKLLVIIIISLALAFSVIGVTPAYAAGPLYVALSGNDGNSCLSPDAACATINAAIGKASDGDTIEVAIGTYTGTDTEVVLINKSVTLSGGWDESFTTQNGATTIDGQAARGGVKTTMSVTATLERFVVQNSHTSSGYSGGIYNGFGTLTLNYSTISGNSAGGGGGIYNESGSLTLNNSTVSDNSAYYGGGIYNDMGSVTLNNSTVSGNSTINQGGGGIYNSSGTLTVNNSTISGNSTAFGSAGGGIYNQSGTLTMNNSTLSNNSAGYGGGLYSSSPYGTLTVNNSTISGNSASGYAGGIYNDYQEGVITLENTLLAGNLTTSMSSGPDCYGPIGSAGYNLIGNMSGCTFSTATGDLVGTGVSPIDPHLASLHDNGGPTFTHALYVNSSAIDAGNPATCLPTDQRGVARPEGSVCDIGAYEGSTPIVIPTLGLPTGTINDTTPTYKWTKISGATQYQYQLVKGATTVYTKTVASSVCGGSTCLHTPINILANATYKWRVRAMVDAVWKDYSAYKTFTVFAIKTGLWGGGGFEFYVTPNQSKVDNFAIFVNVNGCGIYKITHTPLVSIANKHFAFKGSFYAAGNFVSSTTATGTMGLKSFYIPGCGYVSGGPFSWSAKWKSAKQPSSAGVEEMTLTVVAPALDATPFFDVDTVKP